MTISPGRPEGNNANEVLFMPWADVGKPTGVGSITFTPWQEVTVGDKSVRRYLEKYFSRHVDPCGNPVRTIAIVSEQSPDFRPVSVESLERVRHAADALFFSTYCPTVLAAVTSGNNNLAPPTADRYQLVLQRFSLADQAIAVRVGGKVSVGQIRRMNIIRPWDVGGSMGFPDEELLAGFGKMLDGSCSPDNRERIFRSLEWFRHAHLVGGAAVELSSDVSKIVMMATAFEILLKFPENGQKKHFIRCAEESLKRPDALTAIRDDRRGKPHVNSLPACWASDFYKLRSRIAHGAAVAVEDLRFNGWISHLIVADLVFWQFLVQKLYKLVHLAEGYSDLKKGGHADSLWIYVPRHPGEKPACPRAYCTMPLECEATVT